LLFIIIIDAKLTTHDILVALVDLGFVTHAVHMNSRLVYLVSSLAENRKTLFVTGPPDGGVYPPGPGFIYVLVEGVPSEAVKIMVGEGQTPPLDMEATEKYALKLVR
jgi:hypothetical protein